MTSSAPGDPVGRLAVMPDTAPADHAHTNPVSPLGGVCKGIVSDSRYSLKHMQDSYMTCPVTLEGESAGAGTTMLSAALS
jgi:hypothetical protein